MRTLRRLVLRNDAFDVLEVILCALARLLVVYFGVRYLSEYVWGNNMMSLLAGVSPRLGKGGKELCAGQRHFFASKKGCFGSLPNFFRIASRAGNGLQEMGRDDIAALVAHDGELDMYTAECQGSWKTKREDERE